MYSLTTSVGFALLATRTAAMSAVLGSNASNLRSSPIQQTSYGKDPCPCVGIDNLKGYYASQEDYYHVQRPVEAGASCEAWDDAKHPACRGSMPPQWCSQSWCYVDPCNCKLDVVPKMSTAGIKYQGNDAYWSYNTCGGTDFFTADASYSPDACVAQKKAGDCTKNDKCAWDGKQCMGKQAAATCDAKRDEAVHGQDDCRCVGLDGRTTGKAFMYITEEEQTAYPPSVGATCNAWEMDSHPECKKDGAKPTWCSAKWCFVDPCKCKAAIPPKTVMGPNRGMRFQGKTAFWSYATCGSKDTWTKAHSGKYCIFHDTEEKCAKQDRCAWNGKDCLGKALVNICKKQQETGILGMEAPLSGAHTSTAFAAFSAMVMALTAA